MLRLSFYSIVFSLLILVGCNSKSTTQNTSSANTDHFLDSIVSTMSLEEKVGQMTNLTITSLMVDDKNIDSIDMEKVRDVIVKHHVGSIQNVKSNAYSLEKWHEIVNLLQKVTLEETNHKIPSLYCIDAVHGTNYTLGATIFPHNLGLAATRNRALVEEGAYITAMETRASGIRYNFSPVLDCGRQPLWPRLVESFGEDIYLVSEMGKASIMGYQGTDQSQPDRVAACMKHFVGYSGPNSGKDRSPANIPEIVLREYYLPSFQEAVNSGALTCMINSGEVNGVPLHASKYLLTDVLRKELGFEGVIISDWEDVQKLSYRHRIAENNKEAVLKAVDAGIDLCIVPYDYTFSDNLIELVKEGRISMQRIDESVKRVLQLKLKVGLFNNPYVEKEAVANYAQPEYREKALLAAQESITLLKNKDDILPLTNADGKNILVIGPGSESLTALNGCWSFTWQGLDAQYVDSAQKTISEALNARFSNSHITTMKGCGFEKDGIINESEILSNSKKADYIIACIGEDAYAESLGDINDLELAGVQQKLIKLLATSGKPIILILTEGRPRIIREIEPLVDGILLAYWPGSRGATAISSVVAGDYNPDAKLPLTYPKYSGDLKCYDHKLSDASGDPNNGYAYSFEPQWKFGFGLSYSDFTYSDLQISNDSITKTDTLLIKVLVTNNGDVDGKHCIELYSRDLYASITPSVRRLRKFTKIELSAGDAKEVQFELSPQELSFINEKLERITETGGYQIIIGDLIKEFYLK